ncbi:SH3 domain-containing protein [Coprinopsis cinerea okayama7|uniref:SH3 domain-containing protein n=1 Tax=Coprinopsis cinerea (strain Okayama-7 / 130 / ATCC MYA-4618 / FGSC 9003) TaxID=240176 RepID=A8N6V8_COPC7|nr:SH3 domain-containing protein [Coprinopsis cinerea okayama7\|eukprot:XP_001830564.2 SH3 domain-containing protein [Coprinopsis cinerea okayama7\
MQALTARRQSSTTSLSKYERASSPLLQDRSLDFCNAFWGVGDVGVEVLFARMRGATRTIEELRSFWKERAVIEEDYAKRLAKLSKVVLGRDEIGDLRASLDTVRLETERQASFHANLASQIRTDLETPTTAFHNRLLSHKKTQQLSIEKEFKTKQAQEAHVNKAREKYESDGMRINAFTAQSTLVQGKELDKITAKLERAQQTVQVNEREFANFAKILAETTKKWELSWKAFCDNCQDLEEQRIEFMKDNIWAYANAVSTVCVADDESCEKIRLSLEQMEPEREMEYFVSNYGTGNDIPDPPAFVNYNSPDAVPASSQRVTTRPANFIRVSTRELPPRAPSAEPPDDSQPINTAGIGAGGGNRRSEVPADANLLRQDTRRNSMAASPQPYVNGSTVQPPNTAPVLPPSTSPMPASNQQRQSTLGSAYGTPLSNRDPHAEPIDPTAETYIKVGNHAYKVDPSKDPQQQTGAPIANRTASPVKQENGATIDPLEKQLQELKNAVSIGGSTRRNTLHKPPPAQNDAQARASPSVTQSATRPVSNVPQSLSPPGAPAAQINRSPSPNRDYRNSADLVVGAHPAASRPSSPQPPTAAFMMPKNAAPPPGSEMISDVLADYQQSLPGERKAISRNNSYSRRTSTQPQGHAPSASQASIAVPQNANFSHGQNLHRPASVGHAGIGAHGGSRSNSPQPQPVISRGPSPAPNTVRTSYISPPAQNIARAPSPNSIGIALDPNGRVLHDEMAQGYQQHQQALRQQHRGPPPQQQPAYKPPLAPPVQQQQQPQRRLSYMNTPSPTVAPPPQPAMHPVTPPPPPANLYQQPSPAAQPTYGAPPPAAHPTYAPPSQLLYQQQQAPPPQHTQPPIQQQPIHHYQPPPVQQAPTNTYGHGGAQRASSISGGYYGQQQPAPQQAPPPQQQQPQYAQQAPGQGYHQPPQQQTWTAAQRSPSPQPPPPQQQQQAEVTTEDGTPILFYVKALYDYAATIDEEFDFQAGDIIAVTSTPEDGWWTGELLDEARRQRGRNVFPSNFIFSSICRPFPEVAPALSSSGLCLHTITLTWTTSTIFIASSATHIRHLHFNFIVKSSLRTPKHVAEEATVTDLSRSVLQIATRCRWLYVAAMADGLRRFVNAHSGILLLRGRGQGIPYVLWGHRGRLNGLGPFSAVICPAPLIAITWPTPRAPNERLLRPLRAFVNSGTSPPTCFYCDNSRYPESSLFLSDLFGDPGFLSLFFAIAIRRLARGAVGA